MTNDKDNKAGDEPRKPTTEDDLRGVAGGVHDTRQLERDRKDLRSEDLADAVGGCGSRELRRRDRVSDELGDIAAGASRRMRDRGEQLRDAPAVTGAE